MNANEPTVTHRARRPSILLALILVIVAVPMLTAASFGAESSSPPGGEPSAAPSLTTAEAVCASADDLRLIVQFLRDTDTSVDGWLPILVGAIAGISEGRELLGLVDDTYRPLVDDLVVSLEGLLSITDELRGQETVGAQVATLGEAITAVGNAMDALTVAVREPCPDVSA